MKIINMLKAVITVHPMPHKRPASGLTLILAIILGVSYISKELADLGICRYKY